MPENKAVVFDLAGVRYGIDIMLVQEIIRVVEITPVAEADFAVEGIINLRGQVVTVINLSRRLGLPEKRIGNEARIIVVQSNAKRVGLIVDKVLEVGSYDCDDLEDPLVAGASVAFLKGIVKKKEYLWLLLKLSEVA